MRLTGVRQSGSRRALLFLFALIGVFCIAVSAFVLDRTLMLEHQASYIVKDTLTSIRLLARIDRDLAQERILIDRHIYEKQPAAMDNLESELARLDADLTATMEAYEPWATGKYGELTIWENTRAEITSLRASAEQVLELSRKNRDVEARAAMLGVAVRFTNVHNDVDKLIAINDLDAAKSLSTISAIRFDIVFASVGVGLATLVGTFLFGRWTVRQITHREEQAARSRMLEERNRTLDAFAGHVAHDIRGPLAMISLAVTQLSQTAPSASKTVDILRRGIGRMEALIDDLLALARIEAVRGSCDPEVVSSRVRDEFASRVAREKGTLRLAVDHASVRCSDGLLQQALANLVENAVKYHRAGVSPEIGISGVAANGYYELRVSDNGTGMSPHDAARVFEPFFRSQQARDTPGTGLGLSIVKRVAEACGGTVSVATQVGQGTSFLVRLPLATKREIGHGGSPGR